MPHLGAVAVKVEVAERLLRSVRSATSTFTATAPVILGGLEPPISSVSGRCPEPLGHRIFGSAEGKVLSAEMRPKPGFAQHSALSPQHSEEYPGQDSNL